MARKFYVVWAGRQTGIFTTWADTEKQVHQFPKARFKSFKTLEEAEAAYADDRADITIKSVKDKAKLHSKKSPATPNAPIEEQFDFDSTAKTIFDVSIYCDGACDPNPGEAGSGIAIYRNGELAELWYGLYNPHGTNNTAELNALYQALHFAKANIEKGKEVQILCDSKYSIDCVTNWAFNWERKGWRRKKDGDIKNLIIIQQAHELYKEIMTEVVVSHVRGHMGVEGNELADRMAAFGADCQATNFCRYSDTLDIQTILNFRSG